jgi:hypothetical protein
MRKLIGSVLIPGELPRLAQLAVSTWATSTFLASRIFPSRSPTSHEQPNRMLVACGDIVELGPESAAGELPGLLDRLSRPVLQELWP